jgi:hypothetical protein
VGGEESLEMRGLSGMKRGFLILDFGFLILDWKRGRCRKCGGIVAQGMVWRG